MTANSRHKSRILVVDSDRDVFHLIASVASTPDCTMECVGTPEEATVKEPWKYSMMIINSPDNNDALLEYVQALRANPATTMLPVMFVSWNGNQAEVIQAFDTGVDDYVVKPFSVREIKARIYSMLRRSAVFIL